MWVNTLPGLRNDIEYVEYIQVECKCGAGFCYPYRENNEYVPIFCPSCRCFRDMTFQYRMVKWQKTPK